MTITPNSETTDKTSQDVLSTKRTATQYLVLEDAVDETELGRCTIVNNVIQGAKQFLSGKIPDMDSDYKLTILHYTDQEYHTRILLRKLYTIDGMSCEEVKYRATIYDLGRRQEKDKDRDCSFFGWVKSLFAKKAPISDIPLIDIPNAEVINTTTKAYNSASYATAPYVSRIYATTQ